MRFAGRMNSVHRSYIREILKVTARPEVISFAGGLPNPASFPVQQLAEAAAEEMAQSGPQALQYSTTEGYLPLREWIADRYAKQGMTVSADEILITGGSQQALDILAKAMLDEGDTVLMERPGYLGAIQCFSMYGVKFSPLELAAGGVDTDALEKALAEGSPKLFYAVPSFQNPSGISYDAETRRRTAELIAASDCLLVEDNPYGELRFMGEKLPPVKAYMNGAPSVLLGSFSKVVAPGLRLGWVCAPAALMEKLVTVKQASDLHTPTFNQRVLYRYLTQNDVNSHIASICEQYGRHRDVMVQAIQEHFPQQVQYTEPEGGMFLWCTLPEGCDSEEIFKRAIERNVAFVPGRPFYVDGTTNTFRLNYSNASEDTIREGISRLGSCLREALSE
ncbi:PLP-dependent aminotransferase family protein [Oleidesulfovibrio sp.]|uniref:aminotransferase-like domain-containing protein n=1 Tax=Oleidesulfovibrio sp. TaxID=2909707 RepID=UPI003A8466E5